MGQPKNPNTIVVKNRYYPKGLTEDDVWNYYQKMKYPFLDATKNRNVAALIMTDVNKPVIRKNISGKPIRLTPQNYDQIVTGRTVGFYSEMGVYEQFGIIDVDTDDGMKWAKKVTSDVYEFVLERMPIIKKAEIKYTGKTSFHVVCDFGKKMKIETIRHLLETFLRNSELSRAYTIEGRRRSGVPNLDLSPNKIRGNFITTHSLSVIGLRSMIIPYNELNNFDPRKAIVN